MGDLTLEHTTTSGASEVAEGAKSRVPRRGHEWGLLSRDLMAPGTPRPQVVHHPSSSCGGSGGGGGRRQAGELLQKPLQETASSAFIPLSIRQQETGDTFRLGLWGL